jgi:hypothetical protein
VTMPDEFWLSTLRDEVRQLAHLSPEEWAERRGGDPIARTINAVLDILGGPQSHEQTGQPHHYVARCLICGERGHLHITLVPEYDDSQPPHPTQPNVVIGGPG